MHLASPLLFTMFRKIKEPIVANFIAKFFKICSETSRKIVSSNEPRNLFGILRCVRRTYIHGQKTQYTYSSNLTTAAVSPF